MIPDIRKPNQHDLNYILDIDLKCFEDNWTLDQWRQQLTICHNNILLAVQGNTPVGFVLWLKDEITRLAVKPTYRHLGLGTKLVNSVELELHAQGCKDMVIDVPESLCCPRHPIDVSLWLLRRGFRARRLTQDSVTFCGVREGLIRFGKVIEETQHGSK